VESSSLDFFFLQRGNVESEAAAVFNQKTDSLLSCKILGQQPKLSESPLVWLFDEIGPENRK
jgi:hypothetical protein